MAGQWQGAQHRLGRLAPWPWLDRACQHLSINVKPTQLPAPCPTPPGARTRVDLAGHPPLHGHSLVPPQVAHALQHLRAVQAPGWRWAVGCGWCMMCSQSASCRRRPALAASACPWCPTVRAHPATPATHRRPASQPHTLTRMWYSGSCCSAALLIWRATPASRAASTFSLHGRREVGVPSQWKGAQGQRLGQGSAVRGEGGARRRRASPAAAVPPISHKQPPIEGHAPAHDGVHLRQQRVAVAGQRRALRRQRRAPPEIAYQV